MNASSPQRRPSLWGGLALIFGSVVFCLLMGEIIGRILSPTASLWRYPNYIRQVTEVDPTSLTLLRYDPELGYEPKPGASGILMGRPISYSADGLRNQNLDAPPAKGPPIMTLGDSFTEGFVVSDNESWPAHLERDTGRRVFNAAVRAYGLDQAILRGERLAPLFKPRTLILAFIADDIDRTMLSIHNNAHKPYFVAAGQGIELRNVPVPTTPTHGNLNLMRRIFGHSYLLDFIFRRLGLNEWWAGSSIYVHSDGDLVSCRLMDRFAALVRKEDAKGLVVAFDEVHAWKDSDKAWTERDRKHVATVLACAKKAGLATLDTHDGFAAADVASAVADYYVELHLTDRGNALAAKLIAAALGMAEE